MTSQDTPDFKPRFKALAAFITQTQNNVEAGTLGDLSQLDKEVMSLCKDVEAVGGQTAKDAQPMIADMIARLDGLSAALNAYKANKEQQGHNV